jgi:hypothetical protein
MAKTAVEIAETVARIRLELPAAIREGRVAHDAAKAERGTLRITFDGQLIGEWGHGVLGWMQFESAAYMTSDAARAYRAAKRVLK